MKKVNLTTVKLTQLFNKVKESVGSEPMDTITVNVGKIVYRNNFDPKAPTAEDLCPGHKWQKRKDLPKDWVWCPKCQTEKIK